MSWFSEISEKAENLLNTIDKNAAKALSKKNPTSDRDANSCVTLASHASLVEANSNALSSRSSISLEPAEKQSLNLPHTSSSKMSSSLSTDSDGSFLKNDMLQNEIHSLNNEITLLLNRVKISEQKSSELQERLSESERKNIELETELFQLDHASVESDSSKSKILKRRNSKNELKLNIHEHYDKQIQDLIQEKSLAEEKLRMKEDEIIMLKSRLSQKSYSFSADELQSRLRALTITLVEKQSALESLMAEKSSLQLRFNQLQNRYEEAIGIMHQSRINVNDTDDVKAHTPSYQFSGIRYLNFVSPSRLRKLSFGRTPMSKILLLIYIVFLHIFVVIFLYLRMPDNNIR